MGAWLPRTKAEDQLMGDVSDELKEQTKEFAGQQFEKAKKVGERAYDTAQKEGERQGLSGEAVADVVADQPGGEVHCVPCSRAEHYVLRQCVLAHSATSSAASTESSLGTPLTPSMFSTFRHPASRCSGATMATFIRQQ